MSTPSQPPAVFVSAATGNIGGAVARLLRGTYGWVVKSTVRDASSPSAKALSALGVQLLQGDWDDVRSLVAGMAGCDKLFLCTTTYIDDPSLEGVHATNIVRAALSVGSIEQVVVCTSVGVSLHRQCDTTGQQHSAFFDKVMAAKKTSERAVSDHHDLAQWKWTLLRPAIFMTNFLAPQVDYFSPGFRSSGIWRSTMTPDAPLALVLPGDIAKIAGAVFKAPGKYHGRALGVASDVLGVQDVLDQLGAKTGRSYTAHYMSDDEIEEQKDSLCFTIAEKSLRHMADKIDLDDLKAMAELTTFKQFLEKEEEAVKSTYKG